MSFASQLKKEICQNRQFIYSHKVSFAFGLVLMARSFDENNMMFCTEHKNLSRLYSELLYELVEIKTSITAAEQIVDDTRKMFIVTVDSLEDRLEILKFFAPHYRDFELCDPEKAVGDRFLRGMLCGAFLSCANISDPHKSYHLEFVAHNSMACDTIKELLTKLGIHFKQTVRKGVQVVYVKSSEAIEDVLTMLGAGKSALEIMNVKIYKDMRNKVNRITNCETANIDKTVMAASAQVAQIRLIQRQMGLEALPGGLREIAQLRLENPHLALSELCALLHPPLSRSGANYRLKQLGAIADELSRKI